MENISGRAFTPVAVLSSGKLGLLRTGRWLLSRNQRPGTYILQGGSLSAQTEYVGYSGNGSFTQSGGTNASSFLGTGGMLEPTTLTPDYFTQEIEVGGTITQTGGTVHAGDGSMAGMYFAGSGMYNLNHGLLSVNAESIYDSGPGGFVQQGGTHTVVSGLYLENSSLADGIYDLQGGSLSVDSEYVGNSSVYGTAGAFVQSGGHIPISAHLYLGFGSGGVGTYTLSGDGLISAPSEDVGYSLGGSGTFSQSGGTNKGWRLAHHRHQRQRRYSQSAGLLSGINEYVGFSGQGSFTQSGGTHSVTNILSLGYNSGSSGSYLLSGGSLSAQGENIGLSGAGSFMQSAGTNSSPAVLNVGDGGVASYSLSGGLVTTEELSVGGVKNGTFTQSGGAVLAGGGSVIAVLVTGSTGNSPATYNLQAGLLSVTGQDYVGDLGIGKFVQSGGTCSISGGTLLLGSSVLGLVGTGTYDLTAGNVTVPTEYVADYGTGVFLQSGGNHSVSVDALRRLPERQLRFVCLGLSGALNAANEYIGYSGSASFEQTGRDAYRHVQHVYRLSARRQRFLRHAGDRPLQRQQRVRRLQRRRFVLHTTGAVNNSVLYLGYNPGASGNYFLFGAGQLTTSFYEYVGWQGQRQFHAVGGSEQHTGLVSCRLRQFRRNVFPQQRRSASPAPTASTSAMPGTGSFTQSGGTNNASYLYPRPRFDGDRNLQPLRRIAGRHAGRIRRRRAAAEPSPSPAAPTTPANCLLRLSAAPAATRSIAVC